MSMTAISGARNARFQVLIASDVAMLVLNVGQHQGAAEARDIRSACCESDFLYSTVLKDH
jgi:hypothetical protein